MLPLALMLCEAARPTFRWREVLARCVWHATVLLAFAISLLSRPANAYALVALSPVKVPLGGLIVLQFAMNFVNLAMPSTAGRVAVNIRFFQRNGVEPTTAVAVGALDGFIGFLGQLALGGSILLFGVGSVDLQVDHTFSLDAVGSLLVLLAVVLVVGIAVIALAESTPITALVVDIGLCLVLIPIWGITGAAVAWAARSWSATSSARLRISVSRSG